MSLQKHTTPKTLSSIGLAAKEPRLNIRYPNFEIIDNIELEARKLGLKKNHWVKIAIQEKLERDRFRHLFEEERVKGDFEARYILREIGGAELTSKAKSRASEYIQEVMRDDL